MIVIAPELLCGGAKQHISRRLGTLQDGIDFLVIGGGGQAQFITVKCK
jgi:hypothetical protein